MYDVTLRVLRFRPVPVHKPAIFTDMLTGGVGWDKLINRGWATERDFCVSQIAR